MENLKTRQSEEILIEEFALTVEEMLCVKGGESTDPIFKPTPPTVRI